MDWKFFAAHSKAVRDALGHVKAADVDADTLNRVRQAWLEKGTPKGKNGKLHKKSSATTDRYLETLRAAYRLAVKQKRISSDRAPYIGLMKPNNRRTGFVEEEVSSKLYAALSPASIGADVALFAYRSGWRRGEVEGLTWEQMGDPGNVEFLEGKTEKDAGSAKQ